MFKVSNKQNLNHFNTEKTDETLIIDDDVPTQESLEDIDEVSSVASSDDTSTEEFLKQTINEKDIDHLDDIKEATKIISFQSEEPIQSNNVARSTPKFPEPVSFDFGFISPLPKLNTVANFTDIRIILHQKRSPSPTPVVESFERVKLEKEEDEKNPKLEKNEDEDEKNQRRLNETSSKIADFDHKFEQVEDFENPEKNDKKETEDDFVVKNTFDHSKIETGNQLLPDVVQEPKVCNIKANFEDKRIISYIPKAVDRFDWKEKKIKYGILDNNNFHHHHQNQQELSKNEKDQRIPLKNEKHLSEMKRLKKEEMKLCNTNLGFKSDHKS